LAIAQDFSSDHRYDTFGRPQTTVTHIEGNALQMDTRYDLFSRVDSVTYPANVGQTPTRLALKNVYDYLGHGFLIRVENANTPQTYWQLGDNGSVNGAVNASGQIEIDKSRTFQEEMGQWEDPTCYISV